MKNPILRVLSLLLAILCVASVATSCKKEPEDDGSARLIEEGATSYSIVSGSTDKAGWQAANYLADQLEELTGAAFEVIDDRTARTVGVPEILVGKTNRSTNHELHREVRTDEYIIFREEKDIYIMGMGEELLKSACDAFIEQVLGADYRITKTGELLRKSGTYTASSFLINGRPVTDYTLLTSGAETLAVDWRQGLEIALEKLTEITGHIMPTSTYDPNAAELPASPAIVLRGEAGELGMTDYKVEIKGEDIYVTAGTTVAALKILSDFVSSKLSVATGDFALLVSDKTGETGMSSASFTVMSFNVRASDAARALPIAATVLNSMPDFVCMQEYNKQAGDTVTANLAGAGYGMVGSVFTEVSPTALAHAADDADYQTYAHIGKRCYTPILYRTELWEPVEEDTGAYLFYWKSRYHLTNTKSMTYGVFKSKVDGQLVFVISTHFPLVTGDYADSPGYETATNAVEGKRWRDEATQEILKAVNAMRAKYPGILTVAAGDYNARMTEESMMTMVADDTILENAYDLAPEDKRTDGASFHGLNTTPPSATGTPIDHVFVSNDVAWVLSHQILQDDTALAASDHCPVLVNVFRK